MIKDLILNDVVLQFSFDENNVHIGNSFIIKDNKTKQCILQEIVKVCAENGYTYKRSLTSWLREWKAHNVLYKLGYKQEQTGSVDLNEDETIIRRIGYFFLSLLG